MKALTTILTLVSGAALAQTIVCPPDAPANVQLAAKEVRRYAWLRTGELLPIAGSGSGIALKVDPTLSAQQYRLKSDGASLTISGGSDVAVLYGAYTFAERLGVRFEISGDVIPDQRIPFAIPQLDETHQPLFELRGLQPFHDFPEGPDWWTLDDWRLFIGQAVKMRMNFIGLHTYPSQNKDLGPEPTVWIGLPEEVNPDGTVKTADHASWYTTAKFMPYGCYAPGITDDYGFGAAQVFPTSRYGPEINGPDDYPMPTTPAAKVGIINRTGTLLKTVFTEARQLGVRTCVGTESPLDIPDGVKAQLQQRGLNPADPATLRLLYQGMFTRIQRAYPIDHYWIWGHEGEIDPKSFVTNLQCARDALNDLGQPFSLGICGWGWTAGNFPMLDQALPKDLAFSAISMSTGHAPVSENFAKLQGRQKWAIPWFEDDGALTSLQLRAGRMRRDAVDARSHGCNGLMGLHWRTRIIAPNISALAQAAWDQGDWCRPPDVNPATVPRDLPVADFYADWAAAQFGPEIGPAAAAIFTRLDGNFPQTSGWIRGPGAIIINPQPWATVAPRFAFVDEFAALRPHVRGSGCLARFDWWLNTFRMTKSMGEFGCARGELDRIMKRIAAEQVPATKRQQAREVALPLRLKMVGLLGELHHALLATLTNATELGTLCNIQQQSLLRMNVLTGQDAALAGLLGEPLPAAAQPWPDYRGEPRLVVLNPRPAAKRGEILNLRIVALDRHSVDSVTIRFRPLGGSAWQSVPASHVARSVWQAKLPPADADFEYHVTANAGMVWPATAPQLNQSVIVNPANSGT